MIIKLDCKIYDKSAILSTMKEFEDICGVEIKNNDFEIELTPKINEENIDSEFCNHVLFKTIQK